MTDPDTDNRSNNGAENDEKPVMDDSVSVPINDFDESKAQLINANGGASGDYPEVAVIDGSDKDLKSKSSDDVSFNGLGKDEVMQYANDPFWIRLRWILFTLFWVGWLAMLVTAIIIIVLAPRCPPRPDMKWYQKETVYQVYSKSFKDSGNDGFGDLQGLKDKFKHITDDIGVNSVYLNSVFKTDETVDRAEQDLAIVDHKDLDPKFGTVGKFKSWIKSLKKKGQKVILDLIPNQTGKKHEWFKKSVAGDKDYKDYYIWVSSNGSNPPNNWKNMYGESAWEFEATRKQWYYHSRSKDLPDLNLINKAVREEIKEIMKFWLRADVGGFNIQDLEYLVENPDISVSDDADRTQTRNYEGTLLLLEELRDVSDSYSDKPGRERFLFGNVMHGTANQTQSYWGDGKENRLHLVLPNLGFGSSCNASCLSSWIGDLSDDRDQWMGLQLGNQDSSRFASRVSTAPSPNKVIKVFHAMQMLLPGTPFNYYGDEFGQKNGEEAQLSNNRFNPLNARTPMQWTDKENAGFTDKGVTPWLALGSDYKNNNLRVSQSHFNEHTILGSLQKLIKLREKESFQWGTIKACAANKDVLLFTRKAERFPYFLTLINLGADDFSPHIPSISCVETKEKGIVVYHSREEKVGDLLDLKQAIKLEPGDIVVLEFAADD